MGSLFPQIALAIGVLTSSWWVRVRRFCGLVAGGGRLSHRVSLEALCGMCTGVRVRRCKTGLSHNRVSLEVLRGFADVRPGCHRVPLEVLCGMCRGQGSQM